MEQWIANTVCMNWILTDSWIATAVAWIANSVCMMELFSMRLPRLLPRLATTVFPSLRTPTGWSNPFERSPIFASRACRERLTAWGRKTAFCFLGSVFLVGFALSRAMQWEHCARSTFGRDMSSLTSSLKNVFNAFLNGQLAPQGDYPLDPYLSLRSRPVIASIAKQSPWPYSGEASHASFQKKKDLTLQ